MQSKGRERQIITMTPDGVVSGLDHKDGISLAGLGTRKIKRASEIIFNDDESIQKWYVKFLKGKRAGKILRDDNGDIAYFDEYEDGRKAEVETLNKDRLEGDLLG